MTTRNVQASLLDALMGPERNLDFEEQKRAKMDFTDTQVCKSYLCGFCPNQLFVNTKSDLGTCERIHDDSLVEEYLHSNRYQCLGYELEFSRLLKRLIRSIDATRRRREEKLEEMSNPEAKSALATPLLEKIARIQEQIDHKSREAEQLGSEGKMTEACALMDEIARYEEEKSQQENVLLNLQAEAEKKQRICEVCGAYLVVGDAQHRLDEHLKGKLHSGSARIREYLASFDKSERLLEDKLRNYEEKMMHKERERNNNRKERSSKYRDDYNNYRGDNDNNNDRIRNDNYYNDGHDLKNERRSRRRVSKDQSDRNDDNHNDHRYNIKSGSTKSIYDDDYQNNYKSRKSSNIVHKKSKYENRSRSKSPRDDNIATKNSKRRDKPDICENNYHSSKTIYNSSNSDNKAKESRDKEFNIRNYRDNNNDDDDFYNSKHYSKHSKNDRYNGRKEENRDRFASNNRTSNIDDKSNSISKNYDSDYNNTHRNKRNNEHYESPEAGELRRSSESNERSRNYNSLSPRLSERTRNRNEGNDSKSNRYSSYNRDYNKIESGTDNYHKNDRRISNKNKGDDFLSKKLQKTDKTSNENLKNSQTNAAHKVNVEQLEKDINIIKNEELDLNKNNANYSKSINSAITTKSQDHAQQSGSTINNIYDTYNMNVRQRKHLNQNNLKPSETLKSENSTKYLKNDANKHNDFNNNDDGKINEYVKKDDNCGRNNDGDDSNKKMSKHSNSTINMVDLDVL